MLFAGALAILIPQLVGAAARPEAPPYKEVFETLREHASGLKEAELNRAAVQGTLAELHNRAWLLDSNQAADTDTNTVTMAASAVFDENYGYIRVGRVGSGLPGQIAKALESMTTTNKLKGVALDLRFATGTDYGAAGAIADLFLASDQKLFEWSGGVARAHEKTNAFRAPVAVLVNHQTAGAAEALAAVLRDSDVALLIGTNTAGQASGTKDFPLSNGQILRVAVAPVKLSGGDEVGSLKPDIQVDVSPDEERQFFVDAYRMMPRGGLDSSNNTATASLSVTNRSPRRKINEAELVRMSREGIDPEEPSTNIARALPSRPVVTDPALARAIDLLKALVVVRHSRF